jgi:NitT/TauT family transport system permease protein
MSLAPDSSSEWTTLDRPGRLARAARAVQQMLPTLLLSVAALIGWELVIRLGHVSTYIVPAPSAIAVALVAHAQDLAVATVATAREVFVGFVLSLIVGIGLALLIIRFRRFGQALYPLIVFFQTVPKVALAPIFILWFGYDLAPKALLILVIAFFPITLNMLAGLHSVEAGLVALMESVGASENEVLFRVRVPHALPQLMAGVKIAITLCVIGAIVGEFAGASAGLGYVIQFASTQLETPVVFAALVVVSLLGSGFYYVSEILERLIVPWAPQFQDSGRS